MERCGGGGAGRDTGGIVLGWLGRLTLVVGALGFVLFDAISVGAARLVVTDEATDAAKAAARSWHDRGSVDLAYAAALEAAQQTDAHAQVPRAEFRILPGGGIELVVTRRAHTVLLAHLAPVRDWATVSAGGQASPSTDQP